MSLSSVKDDHWILCRQVLFRYIPGKSVLRLPSIPSSASYLSLLVLVLNASHPRVQDSMANSVRLYSSNVTNTTTVVCVLAVYASRL
jgi:hypothetical protein